MKRKLLCCITMMMMCLFCLTGCIQFRTEVEVLKTGRMNVSILLAESKELLEQSGGEFSQEQLQEYIKQGFTAEKYDTEDYTGYILSKKNFDPTKEDLDGTQKDNGLFGGGLNYQKNDAGNYELNIPVSDLTGDYGTQMAQMNEVLQSQGGFMELKLILPCAAISSNATEQQGRALVWNLTSPDLKSIQVEFNYNFLVHRLIEDYWFVGVIGLGVLIVLILIVLLINGVKKRAQSTNYYY